MKYSKEMMEISKKLELEDNYTVIQCIYNIDVNKDKEIDVAILDRIHRKKIDISDAIYVVNIDGYIGSATRNEIRYATLTGKDVIYHEPV
ncbi:MAG TPA: hypothetical protein GX725_03865 [Mollicutes bacterium]|jgi:hypothetical protein|nr:hypothetical protein [Mollicutes bacterium]